MHGRLHSPCCSRIQVHIFNRMSDRPMATLLVKNRMKDSEKDLYEWGSFDALLVMNKAFSDFFSSPWLQKIPCRFGLCTPGYAAICSDHNCGKENDMSGTLCIEYDRWESPRGGNYMHRYVFFHYKKHWKRLEKKLPFPIF